MANKLPDYQLLANEQFFTNISNFCIEGGLYCWPAIGETFVIKKKVFYGSAAALSAAKSIVSEEFFTKKFKLEPTN